MRDLFRSRTFQRLALFVLCGIVALFFLDVFILPWIIHAGAERAIPDVVGKPLSHAEAVIEAAGMRPVYNGKTKSEHIEQGSVVLQNPPAGSVVREGRNVYLTVSGGEEEIQFPNLRGKSLRDAKFTLERIDIEIGKITYEPADLPEDVVLNQSIPAGRTVKKNSKVDLTVSSGQQLMQISVPYLIGLYLEEAQSRLTDAGLRVGVISYRGSSELLPNTIIDQSPKSGDLVDANTPIDLVIVH